MGVLKLKSAADTEPRIEVKDFNFNDLVGLAYGMNQTQPEYDSGVIWYMSLDELFEDQSYYEDLFIIDLVS